MPERINYQVRSKASDFKTREADDGLHIEGYFAVFNTI